jgi:ABC-type multidrug transport system ATPase subunit
MTASNRIAMSSDARVITIGRSGQNTFIAAEPSISALHARISLTPEGHVLEDLQSTYGTWVNDVRLTRGTLKPGDIVRFGQTATYRFTGDALVEEHRAIGMSVSLSGITISRNGQVLLDDVTAEIPPGRFVGLLGPSGAGKSLLLGCMATSVRHTAGSIHFDGRSYDDEDVALARTEIGQVPQDDILHEGLTVDEQLRYACRLRLPDLSTEEREGRITEVVGLVGLEAHRVKPLSVLSGGQRKRVSVAVELLRRPRLLLLDEPTSGVDPGMQAKLMGVLRRLSRRGITVVCTTHTLDTLHYFDDLLVLGVRHATGRIAYRGKPADLLRTFGVKDASDLFEQLSDLNAVAEDASPGSRPHGLSSTSTSRSPPPLPPARLLSEPHVFAGQAVSVAHRGWLALRRDRAGLWMLILQPMILALLVVVSQAKQERSVYVHFFLVISALWLGMNSTVRDLVRERHQYARDRLAGLNPQAYLLGRSGIAVLIVLCQVAVLLATAMALLGVPGAAKKLVYVTLMSTSTSLRLLVLTLTGCGGVFVGLAVSTVAHTERAAVAALPLLVLPQMLLSRVASGHSGVAWDDSGPYTAVGWLKRECFDGPIDAIQLAMSSLLHARPATAVLDMPAQANAQDWGLALAGEWVHLILLLLSEVLLLHQVFRRREPTWLHVR